MILNVLKRSINKSTTYLSYSRYRLTNTISNSSNRSFCITNSISNPFQDVPLNKRNDIFKYNYSNNILNYKHLINNSILKTTNNKSNHSNNNHYERNSKQNSNGSKSYEYDYEIKDNVFIITISSLMIIKIYSDMKFGVIHCDDRYKNNDEPLEIIIPFEEENGDLNEEEMKISNLKLFIDTIGNDIWYFIFGIVTAFISSWVGLQIPKVFGKLIDNTKSGASLREPAIHAVLILFAQASLNFIYSTLISVACERYSSNLRGLLFKSILEQEVAFFDQNSTGDLINRLSSDVQLVRSALKHSVSLGVKSLGQIIGGVFSLILISPKLSLGMLVILPGMVTVGSVYAKWLKSLSVRSQRAQAKSTAVANEAISNIRTVVAFSNQSLETEKFNEKNKESEKLSTESGIQIGLFQGITTMALNSVSLLVYWYGGLLVSRGEITGGELTSFIIHTMNMQSSFSQLSILFTQVMHALGGMSRITELINRQPRISNKNGKILPNLRGEIKFDKVEFYYPTRSQSTVLKDFSLHLNAGQIVALAGASGGGKSTVVSLLERFYDVTKGNILIDGIPIREIDPKWLRSQIGIVSQEPTLFSCSILENLKYGAPDATMEQIIEATKLANAHQFIEAFPNGYDTVVGERGCSLSGGQKQRIAIARAILKNPRIIILDEATSALDSENEQMVQEALYNLMKGRTTIIIAHRLSTVQNADSIAVLSKGRVVEYGNHQQLMKEKGIYYQLVKRQLSLG
ncbi:ABC transporter B family protein [Tieghemostelium lacteum]|uniref:ABC transporter B family protein n=1 Tax=Tieghemostelium lacteum TaxID=361077 RepID=A0A151ZBG9_TIELA|nr:ABC transporter B family protein [Tieghemostelium lacteum]|eukprot:KYQ91293.1 ABC transporter B family protein [Tieghemostelium lacteum]